MAHETTVAPAASVGWAEILRDVLVLCGWGMLVGGVWAAYGGPWALMCGGSVLLSIGLASAWRA